MKPEIIAVTANGKAFTGWKTVSLSSALNEACRGCVLTVSEVPGTQGAGQGEQDDQHFDNWSFPPNTAVQVTTNGDKLLDGYVDTYAPSGSKEEHTITLTIRGKGMDWVDTSVIHATMQFENMKPEDIAKQLDACGVGVDSDVDTGGPVKVFRARQGSSPHKEVMRLCQQRKLVMKGKADGGVTITRAGNKRHSGSLKYGGDNANVERYSGELSARLRFSDYLTLGQDADGLWSAPKGEAKDSKVPRTRPKVVIDQAQTNSGLLRTRAEWERSRAAGNSAKATITTPSFRDSSGTLWEPSYIVACDIPPLKLKQDMILEKVEFVQDKDGGTRAVLTVVDPRTYAGEQDSEDEESGLYDQDTG